MDPNENMILLNTADIDGNKVPKCYFYAQGMEFGGIVFLSCLSVCLYVCVSVTKKKL